MDGGRVIFDAELTDSTVDDASVGVRMIEGIEAAIARCTADGAYDTRAIYEALEAAGTHEPTIVIPPRRTASPSKPVDESLARRDAAIARIGEVGPRQWRKEADAHRQARAENGMYRYKRLAGDELWSKRPEARRREATIAVKVINKMTALGTPESVPIDARGRGEGGRTRLCSGRATVPGNATDPCSEGCAGAPGAVGQGDS